MSSLVKALRVRRLAFFCFPLVGYVVQTTGGRVSFVQTRRLFYSDGLTSRGAGDGDGVFCLRGGKDGVAV